MLNVHMAQTVGGMSRTAEGDTGPSILQGNMAFAEDMGHGVPGTEDAQAWLDGGRLALVPLTVHDNA